MDKILIIDSEPAIVDLLVNSLKQEYEVQCCLDPGEFVEMAMEFQPALVVADLSIPGVDMSGVLQSLFMSGFRAKIVASCRYISDYITQRMYDLGASALFQRPCEANNLLQAIIGVMLDLQGTEYKDVRRCTNDLLLQMGFRMNLHGYGCVLEAVLYLAEHPDCVLSTELYPEVAKRCNGTALQVEKAIRDCIKNAYLCRNAQIWQLYFPLCLHRKKDRITNAEFLNRMAYAIREFMEYKKDKTGTD